MLRFIMKQEGYGISNHTDDILCVSLPSKINTTYITEIATISPPCCLGQFFSGVVEC